MIWERRAAATCRSHSFETQMPAEENNFAGLGRINRELMWQSRKLDSPQRGVLALGSTQIALYGEQERSA